MVNWVMGPGGHSCQCPSLASTLLIYSLKELAGSSTSMGLAGRGGLILKVSSWWVWGPHPQLCRALLTRPWLHLQTPVPSGFHLNEASAFTPKPLPCGGSFCLLSLAHHLPESTPP